MRCEQVKSVLNELIEGTLSEPMRQQVQRHLELCGECQREFRLMQGIWRGLSAMPEVVPPADLHARIMTHVRANTRLREAQPRGGLFRWFGAAAAAATLFLMGFFVAQSDGVQAAFGFGGKRKPTPELAQPVRAGIFVEYRTTSNGARLPVLLARMNREMQAELRYTPPEQPNATPVLLWQGTLQAGRTVEIPLQTLLQSVQGRVVTLHWRSETQSSLLFMPVGYPRAKVASVRLQAKLGDALRQLASLYQAPIEYAAGCSEPLVVLDVQEATLEEALRQLLVGTGCTLVREGELWRVIGP